MRSYLWRLLVALDQLGNTLAGGDPDETITSRAEKARRRGARWGRWLCAGLDRIDRRHCPRGVEPDEGEPL